MARATIQGPIVRLCPKCQLLLHILQIKFDVNFVNDVSVEVYAMCGHGHKYIAEVSSEYGIDLSINTMEWEEVV